MRRPARDQGREPGPRRRCLRAVLRPGDELLLRAGVGGVRGSAAGFSLTRGGGRESPDERESPRELPRAAARKTRRLGGVPADSVPRGARRRCAPETRGREPRRDRLRPRVGVRGAGPRREPPRVGADVRIHRRRRIRRPRLSRTALLGLVPGKPLRDRKKNGNARARVGDGARRLRRGGDVRTPAASLGVGVERLSRFGRRARRAPPRRRRRRRGPGGDRRLRDGHARLAPDGPRVRQSVFFIFGRDFFGVLIGVRGVLIGGVLEF